MKKSELKNEDLKRFGYLMTISIGSIDEMVRLYFDVTFVQYLISKWLKSIPFPIPAGQTRGIYTLHTHCAHCSHYTNCKILSKYISDGSCNTNHFELIAWLLIITHLENICDSLLCCCSISISILNTYWFSHFMGFNINRTPLHRSPFGIIQSNHIGKYMKDTLWPSTVQLDILWPLIRYKKYTYRKHAYTKYSMDIN